MGRKIPGRKHRGVVDPVKQKREREAKLKKIVNAPPTSLDQPIPKSMLEFARLKAIGQKSQFTSGGKKKKKAPDGAFVRQVYAEDKGKDDKLKSKDKKNKIHNDNSSHSRKIQLQKQRHQSQSLDSDDELIDQTHGKMDWKDGTEKRKKNLPGAEPKKKVDRRIEKRKKMLEKKREKMEEKAQSVKKDVVAFGEVAHEPPSMRIKPKYASTNERQMGLKDLHLKRMLNNGSVAPIAMVSAATAAKPKVRLRDLSARDRDEAERKQQDAIAAYKLIKSKKYSGNNPR